LSELLLQSCVSARRGYAGRRLRLRHPVARISLRRTYTHVGLCAQGPQDLYRILRGSIPITWHAWITKVQSLWVRSDNPHKFKNRPTTPLTSERSPSSSLSDLIFAASGNRTTLFCSLERAIFARLTMFASYLRVLEAIDILNARRSDTTTTLPRYQ
jgi:hypothetical protein